MATSHAIYKKEITDYLKSKFDKNAKILDVGAGEGTYLPFLQDYFSNIEAVEVFKPNIDNYDLENRYKKVYNVNIIDFKYDHYDIIIFGDIIEHLEIKEAQMVLEYAYNRCKEMVVAVPYMNKQGIEENNIYEIHKQDDLTDNIMKERYPYLKNVFKNEIYGYYIKEGRKMKNYLVKALINFDDYEGLDANNPANPHIRRDVDVIFNCDKERYEYLKSKNAVMLMGIEEIKEQSSVITNNTKEEKPKKKKASKK